MKVDIGCGKNKKQGFVGIDQFPGKEVDIVCNINKKIKLKDNSVSILYSHHVLEHVESLEKTMEEIYRICKKNSIVIIEVPHFSGRGAFYEFHRRFFRCNSFEDFEQKEKDMFTTNKVKIKIIGKRLRFLKRWYYPWNFIVEPLINFSEKFCIIYEETFLKNLFPAYDLQFKMKIIK